MQIYDAHGLHVHSELVLPELLSAPARHPDVTIRYGEVPSALENPLGQGVVYQAKLGQFLLTLEGIASYLVHNGSTITIDPAPQSEDADVRVFLLGSAFGALLHQRGVLPLHGSAIETPHGAVAFVGHSGHGKSTLASAFYQRGYRLLSDDVCAITLDTGKPVAWPSYPQLHLWADVFERLREGLPRAKVRAKLDKYGIPITAQFVTQPLPLLAIYELRPVNTPTLSLQELDDTDKFEVVLTHTYRRQFLEGLGLRTQRFHGAVATAQPIKVSRVTRPQAPFEVKALVELLEADFQAV